MTDRDHRAGLAQSDGHGDESRPLPSRGTGFPSSELPENDMLTLAAAIESEIIPRLLRAHRVDTRPLHEEAERTDVARKAIADFATLVMTQDGVVIGDFVTALMAQGATLDAVFLDLLAPTAAYLGDLWWNDTCSFADVTLALFKLQDLLRAFGASGRDAGTVSEDALLLAAVPGSQHVFGSLMVEEFFRRSGWTVSSMPGATAKEIIAAVRSNWFAVAGLSMSSDAYASQLPAFITTLRRVSRNRAIVILVGGSYFNENPEQVALVGADATASNARDAVIQAKRLLTAVPRN